MSYPKEKGNLHISKKPLSPDIDGPVDLRWHPSSSSWWGHRASPSQTSSNPIHMPLPAHLNAAQAEICNHWIVPSWRCLWIFGEFCAQVQVNEHEYLDYFMHKYKQMKLNIWAVLCTSTNKESILFWGALWTSWCFAHSIIYGLFLHIYPFYKIYYVNSRQYISSL